MLADRWNQKETDQIEVRVRQTSGGPRIFVDGKPIRPRFFYGAIPSLCEISWIDPEEFVLPFRAEADTDNGFVRFDVADENDTMWFSKAKIVDVTEGTTNAVVGASKEECTKHYRKGGIKLRKGHLYRYLVTHRAARFRTYFRSSAAYVDGTGVEKALPLPYGDTLNETARFAAEAEVNLVTFSTDTSWGCEGWWAPPEEQPSYGRIDRACEQLIAVNPKVLLIPRVKADAPAWMLQRRPDMRMKFDAGYTIEMSSVSCRDWRNAAVAEVGKLARHLRAKFPRNFAGLHISGQNSAEWFYMMSQSGQLSGYDIHTRDAFRNWLAARGESDADTAEIPSAEERRRIREGNRYDSVRDRRLLDFGRFRQEEMASLLNEFGAEIRRATDGKVLSLFFYGYTWEVGGVCAGAAETGHFFMEWLMKHGRGNIDGFSAPISYTNREWPGSAPVMSAAETIMRNGFLWINENDNRTHHEDIWDHMVWSRTKDEWHTRQMFLRDSAVQILKGYGDWWMDLMGRGWFRDREVWQIRRELNRLDDAMLARKRPYSPEIAIVVNEESFMGNSWRSNCWMWPLLNRRGYDESGITYGQYFLNDVLENPPDAKLFVLLFAPDLNARQREQLATLKTSHPRCVFLKNVQPADLSAEAVAAHALRAGAHAFTAPGKAYVVAADGYAMIQAHSDGDLEIDFGVRGVIVDFLSGRELGHGPKLRLPFTKGETRIFSFSQEE